MSGIVSSASTFEWDGDSTADPEPFRKNIDTLMQLLDSEPEILSLNGQQCWGIRLPRKRGDGSMGGILAAMMIPPSVGDYIVVGDPDRNAELSSLVFSDKELLAHMVEKNIRHVQSQAKTTIENEMRSLGLEKYAEARKKVGELNNPVKVGMFDRLLKEANQGEIELIKIFRDRKDREMFEGERPFDPNRLGSESGEKRFIITKDGEHLVFTWEGKDTTWETVEEDGQKIRKMVQTPATFKALMRNNNGTLEYAEVPEAEKGPEWSSEPDYKLPNADQLHDIFGNIEVVTIEEWLEKEDKQIAPAEEVIKALNACAGSVEYVNKFRELGIAHYPSNELIVNPGRKINYVVDSTTPPPPPGTQNLN